jgi:hypothetical protein
VGIRHGDSPFGFHVGKLIPIDHVGLAGCLTEEAVEAALRFVKAVAALPASAEWVWIESSDTVYNIRRFYPCPRLTQE